MDTPSEAVRRKSKKNVMSRDVKYLSVKNLGPIGAAGSWKAAEKIQMNLHMEMKPCKEGVNLSVASFPSLETFT